MLTVKIIESKTMYSVQELCLHLFSTNLHSVEFILTSLVSSIFSVHSSTNLFTNILLHLQFLYSRYSVRFITFTLTITRTPNKSFIPYAIINQFFAFTATFTVIPTLHSLLSQILQLNLHLHLHVSCHSMHLVSLVPNTRLKTLTFKFFTISGAHNFAHRLLILF